MTSSSDEPDNLPDAPNMTHRLVGAVVLVLFAVVALPLVLNGGDATHYDAAVSPGTVAQPIGTVIDPYGTATTGSAAASLGPDRLQRRVYVSRISPKQNATTRAVVREGGSIRGVQIPTSDTNRPTPSAITGTGLQLQLIDEDSASQSDSGAVKETSVVAAFDRGWVVRIGTFAVAENADKIVQRLSNAGFDAQTTIIKSENRTVTRVWIGPFRDRVTAARQRTDIEQTTDERGFLAPYP